MQTGRACQISPIARKQMAMGAYAGLGLRGTARTLGTLGMTGTAGGAVKGASTGAAIGSYVPVIGTVIGAIGGAIGGAIAGSLGKKDPEQYNFDGAVQLWQGNRLAVLNLANKYLPIAGLFDLHLKGPHIPIYLKYGRMGEERFVHDLALLVYQAAQSGQITAQDTPQTVMVKVVQPWIDSWGFGPMNDPHQDLINLLIMGMIADYVSGAGPQAWRSIGGGLPASFAQIPPFSLPGGTATAPAAQYASGTAVTQSPISAITTPTASAPARSAAANVTPVINAAAAGAGITPGQSLPFGGGTFSFGSNGDGQGNTNVLFNGADTLTLAFAGNPDNPVSRGVRLQVASNGALVLVQASGNAYGWTTGGWQYLGSNPLAGTPATAAAAPLPPATTTPVTTAVSVPAGFNLVGVANNLQAYLGPDGNYYSWSGTAMSPLTGTLLGNTGQVAYVLNGQLQAPPAPQPINTAPTAQSVYSGPSYAASVPQSLPSYAATPTGAQPAATSPAVAAAGLTGPAWLGIAAVGVLGWMLLSGKTGVREHAARSHA